MSSIIGKLAAGLVTLTAILAIASSAASAAPCTKVSGGHATSLCIEGQQAVPGEEFEYRSTLKTGTSIKVATPSGISVECTSESDNGTARQESGFVKFSAGLTLKNCHVATPARCAVEHAKEKGAITSEALTAKTLSPSESRFFPTTGDVFVKITYTNNGGTCTIAGTEAVSTEGKKEGEYGPIVTFAAPEASELAHSFTFHKSQTYLEFFEERYTIEGECTMSMYKHEKATSWSLFES